MEFKKEHNYLRNRLEKIQRFNCSQEKSILLSDDDISNEEIYEIISSENSPKTDNEMEALAFIIKASMESVSDIYTHTYECTNCKIINEEVFELESFINTDFESEIPIGLFTSLEDIINKSEDLVVKDYNKYKKLIYENNEKILDLNRTCICRSCKEKNTVIINPLKFLSRNNLAGMYEEFFTLMYYLNQDIKSIESMYPFERELYLGLAKKKIEESPTV